MNKKKLDILLEREIRLAVLEVEFVRGFAILENDMVKVCRSYRPQVNEGIASVVGLLLSGPYILKLFGGTISYLDSLAQKYLKIGFGGQKLAKIILDFAEKYHHKVMWIFEKVAEKFTKDKTKVEKVANMMFATVIGALLGHTVGDFFEEIVNQIETGSFDTGVLVTAAKAAIKGKELQKGIINAFSKVTPDIIAAAS
jgi:hypothetical protein